MLETLHKFAKNVLKFAKSLSALCEKMSTDIGQKMWHIEQRGLEQTTSYEPKINQFHLTYPGTLWTLPIPQLSLCKTNESC